MLIYDLEIVKAIPDRKKAREPDIEYCSGWHDHANMGVSVIGAYDAIEDRFRVFTKEAFGDFEALAKEPDGDRFQRHPFRRPGAPGDWDDYFRPPLGLVTGHVCCGWPRARVDTFDGILESSGWT